MQIQEVAKGRIDTTKVTTTSDACMPILERYFLNPGYWKRGQRKLFCVKRRECGRAWRHYRGLVAALPAVWNGYRYTPKAISNVDDTVMHCRMCVFRSAHIGPDSQLPRERPSILPSSVSPMWYWGWSYKKSSTAFTNTYPIALIWCRKYRFSCLSYINTNMYELYRCNYYGRLWWWSVYQRVMKVNTRVNHVPSEERDVRSD